MKTRSWIFAVGIIGVVVGVANSSLAASFIAIAWLTITLHLHAIEVKVNKLLDHVGITVSDKDMD